MRIKDQLSLWGTWRRYYVIGIGFSSATIESKIMSGEIFGDGNVGGAKNKGGANFTENPLAESVDIAVKKLERKYPKEMMVIKAHYITQWSIRKISREVDISKYHGKQLLERGRTLIEGKLN